MNTRSIVIGITLVVLAAGAYVFVNRSASAPPAVPVRVETTANGRYRPYTPESFGAVADRKRVLFFFAPWCPTCVPVDREISANEQDIPEDVVVFRTSYDNETELKKKYAITYQHTFVLVDERGNELNKWNGGGLDDIVANTQ